MLLAFALLAAVAGPCLAQYQPNWDSIDSRPLPGWYDNAKFGIFIHWGVFSVPSLTNEWFWMNWVSGNKQAVDYMKNNYPPSFTYQDFGRDFHAELYDPNQWADVFAASGAKYIVLTSKHHEGFTNWPSNVSWNWNAMDIGPKRDLVGDLATAVRSKGLHFGLYHSMMDWFHPFYLADKAGHWKTQLFPPAKALPELKEIVNTYKPEVIWSDGDWEAPDTYWNSTEFLAWLYNESPVKDIVVVNDRWGTNMPCHHGGYYTCSDQYNPGVLVKHKWESCIEVDTHSWGYRRDMVLSELRTTKQIIDLLVTVVSCNGNLLLNIGPTSDGRIVVAFEQRLREVGQWLQVNGDAIYGTTYWTFQNDTKTKNVWYTTKAGAVYGTFLDWPTDNKLLLGAPQASADTVVSLLGFAKPLPFQTTSDGLLVSLPDVSFAQLPGDYAWTLKLDKLKNAERDEEYLDSVGGILMPPVDTRAANGKARMAKVNGEKQPSDLKYHPRRKPIDL